MLALLLNTTLPILLVVGLAMLVGSRMPLDPRTLSRSTIFLFSPALALYSLLESDMPLGEAGSLVLAGALLCLLLAGAAGLVARGLPLSRRQTSSFILVVFIMNAGNFGLPFNEFAFGPAGLQRAVVFMVGVALAINSLGVYVASRGHSSMRVALLNMMRNPLPYAVVVGVAINLFSVPLPLFLRRVIVLLAQAAVPVQLVILGLQLRATLAQIESAPWRLVLVASLARFGLGLAAGLFVAFLLGLTGLSRQVVILQAAMPAGVFSGVLAVEYGGDADFAAATILITTLAALFILPLVLLAF